MAKHCNIRTWNIPRTEEPGGLGPWGHKEQYMTEELRTQALE